MKPKEAIPGSSFDLMQRNLEHTYTLGRQLSEEEHESEKNSRNNQKMMQEQSALKKAREKRKLAREV